MELFNKAIKKISEEEYSALYKSISERKESKVHIALDAARNHNYDDAKMMEILAVNSSAYYTLKSRLKTKLAEILSKNIKNPISVLLEEVNMVHSNLFGTNKDLSIRALKELEKKLLEYDLVNEVIEVYKMLLRINIYNDDYNLYNKMYNKYVAYSLAVVKAENNYFDFYKKIGIYRLTLSEYDFEAISISKRETANIIDLYESHRLFVIYNLMNLYYHCLFEESIDSLKLKEIEIDDKLKEISEIFNKYSLDTFYQNSKIIIEFIYFEFYLKTKNPVRADFHLNRIQQNSENFFGQYILHFNTVNYLYGKLKLFHITGDKKHLFSQRELEDDLIDIEKEETFNYIFFKQYQALVNFYLEEYKVAAKMLNDLRIEVNTKSYLMVDSQLKIFQALQYAILGDEELTIQLINSVKRQTNDEKDEVPQLKLIIKIIQTAIKPGEFKKKLAKLQELNLQFIESNNGKIKFMDFIILDDKILKLLAEPYKTND